MIRVQSEDFDIGRELAALTDGRTDVGGLACFVGLVRDFVEPGAGTDTAAIRGMTLEHYPGMTEKMLADIEAEANRRWPLQASLVIHRYGTLKPGDRIVLVAATAAHRE
ncbi:MAG: molybdenum cofactor biosynthesis protein MoaE, partial [Pseudomonadota bacterium]